jgi:hypothetical protein
MEFKNAESDDQNDEDHHTTALKPSEPCSSQSTSVSDSSLAFACNKPPIFNLYSYEEHTEIDMFVNDLDDSAILHDLNIQLSPGTVYVQHVQ